MPAPSSSVVALERTLLRRGWWLFPLLGLIAAMLASRYGWWFVAGDPALINRDVSRALRLPYVLLVPLMGLVPIVWAWSLRLPQAGQRMAWLLALVAVVMVEVLVRQPAVQRVLWTATKTRSPGTDDFFLREVANLRLRVLDDRADDPERIIFAGTSQLIRGINYDMLQRALPHVRICPRSVAGMVPFRMLSAMDYLSIRPGDTVVLYLSEFDLGGVEGFDADWRRPTASLAGTLAAYNVLPRELRMSSWRPACDVAMAGVSEIWSSRDATRHILHRLAGRPVEKPAADLRQRVEHAQKDEYARGLAGAEFRAVNLRSLEILLMQFNDRCAHVVAFEGQINPAMATAGAAEARQRARKEFSELFARYRAVFVPVSAQQEEFGPADFSDGTHLNEAARDRFTAFVANWLSSRVQQEAPR